MPWDIVRLPCGSMSHAEDAVTLLGEGGREVQRRRRLGDAALLVGERDDLGLAVHEWLRCSLRKPIRWVFAWEVAIPAWRTTIPGWPRARPLAQPAGALDRLLSDKRICICGGSGGVGKTTTSAALALGLAARGQAGRRRDDRPRAAARHRAGPRERSATEPRRVDATRVRRARASSSTGELWAMMLDAKRTFDELSSAWRPDERTRDEMLANRIYRELSTAVAGSQEFTRDRQALRARTRRATSTCSCSTRRPRATRWTSSTRPTACQLPRGPGAAGVPHAGQPRHAASSGAAPAWSSRCFAARRAWTCSTDLSCFFRSLGGMIDGFRERAERVNELLADPATTFLIVTSPEREPIDEAIYFRRKLRAARMPFGGADRQPGPPRPAGRRRRRDALARRSPSSSATRSSPRRCRPRAHDYDVLARRDSREHRAPDRAGSATRAHPRPAPRRRRPRRRGPAGPAPLPLRDGSRARAPARRRRAS